MDPVLIAAYTHMLDMHHCSVDDILTDPDLRAEFLRTVRTAITDRTERDILQTLTNLRKRSKLPKTNRTTKAA